MAVMPIECLLVEFEPEIPAEEYRAGVESHNRARVSGTPAVGIFGGGFTAHDTADCRIERTAGESGERTGAEVGVGMDQAEYRVAGIVIGYMQKPVGNLG